MILLKRIKIKILVQRNLFLCTMYKCRRFNDLYIDAVYVEGTASTQITNVLDGTSGLDSQDIDTTTRI